jgi:hypothetical protein
MLIGSNEKDDEKETIIIFCNADAKEASLGTRIHFIQCITSGAIFARRHSIDVEIVALICRPNLVAGRRSPFLSVLPETFTEIPHPPVIIDLFCETAGLWARKFGDEHAHAIACSLSEQNRLLW